MDLPALSSLPAKDDPRIDAFIDALASTGDVMAAAALAGVPASMAYALATQSHVQSRLDVAVWSRFRAQTIPAAMLALNSALTSEDVPAAVKVRASLGALDLTRRIEEAELTKGREKPISELTADELETRLEHLRAQEARIVGQ